ncbi:MAG: AraC family transcriptional regulator [Lachnospiraceae bacterium]|nr:AraC family transcriptional regulator [Lachnospiraceae bacterium]
MKKETRTVVYDDALRLEAYRFEGIVQPFPSHFHEHYVIGLVEKGERILSCRDREYTIEEGSILLFNPGDSHACVQSDGGTFDYRGFNISKEIMLDLAEEATEKKALFDGNPELPVFSRNVIYDEEAACHLRLLHEMVMKGTGKFMKEETLLFLLSYLILNYGQPSRRGIPECRQEIEKACEYMSEHFMEHIYLDQICRYAGLSKSTLLRAFTKEKGVTPYRYLETIRINEAKKLLSEGIPPVEAGIRTGFSDQSHFTNYFNQFIGLAPGAYREIFSDKDGDDGLKEKPEIFPSQIYACGSNTQTVEGRSVWNGK